MISIVFCSKDPKPQYIEHLKNSCGVKDVEVIAIKNSGDLSLAQSYNHGLEKSKYDTVVFTHDDVVFNTQPWGYKLLKHFDKNPEFGIIGLAGTDFMSNGTWWSKRDNMLGRVYHQNEGKRWLSEYSKSFGNQLVEVVSVDGVFIGVRKDRIKKNFNLSFLGFHFYDIPFCVDNHLEGVKVGVCTNIELTHFSVGQTNQQWRENKVLFESMYSDKLPLKIKRDIIIPKDRNFKFKKTPKVSVIIHTKDKLDLLFPCLTSIYEKTKYGNYEILIADTGSTDENKSLMRDFIKDHGNTTIIEFDYYNFAKINNEVVGMVKDPELLLFCNNDIEFLNDNISRMVHFYTTKPNVGTLGGRHHYEDSSIQHNGIDLRIIKSNLQMFTVHIDGGKTIDYHEETRETLGNTGALLMISYDKFNECGTFNEEYRHCFEDVELSMNTIINGYKNYTLSECVSYHKESQTRDISKEMSTMQEDFKNLLLKRLTDNLDSLNKYITVVE